MDITKFIVSARAQSYGDFSAYHAQLSRRLLRCRKRLGIATKSRGKYSKKDEVTAENVKENKDYVYLLLLTSERAWAHARSMKASRAAKAQDITGRVRSHIISRMVKAARAAEDLVAAVGDVVASGATTVDVLEAYAYAGQMRGAAQFEKQCWDVSLKDYSVSYSIYRALMSSRPSDSDTFKELLADPIEPSIQFAAYQLKTPRTVPIEVISRKALPQTNPFLIHEIDKLDPTVLRHTGHETKMDLDDDVPKTLTWRGRQVRIEDAHIATTWAATEEAKSKLAETLSSPDAATLTPKEIAASYESVLTASQDAADATRQAIGALIDEGVPQSDARMQSLQITRTAVNYEMISWRIGRNRVLMGSEDGANEDYAEVSKKKIKKQKDEPQTRKVKVSQKLAKLKERVALYDGALQSLEETMGLPGVPADEELSTRIKASAQYFTALKCLAIARSHAIAGSNVNSLALLHHGYKTLTAAAPLLSKAPQPPPRAPLDMVVSGKAARSLCDLLDTHVTRYRALVHIDNLREASKEDSANEVPLIDRLGEYPPGGVVDLDNIVEYPPKPTFVPLKPILLDLAWNHIDYPKPADKATVEAGAEAKPQKKGWFGFGR